MIANARETREETVRLCEVIRAQCQRSSHRLLIVLDRWQASQVQYVLELGDSRCLIKPFDQVRLMGAVGELLAPSEEVRPNA